MKLAIARPSSRNGGAEGASRLAVREKRALDAIEQSRMYRAAYECLRLVAECTTAQRSCANLDF